MACENALTSTTQVNMELWDIKATPNSNVGGGGGPKVKFLAELPIFQ